MHRVITKQCIALCVPDLSAITSSLVDKIEHKAKAMHQLLFVTPLLCSPSVSLQIVIWGDNTEL